MNNQNKAGSEFAFKNIEGALELGAVEIKEYLAILLKRKWIFLVCVIVPIILASAYMLSKPDVYRSVTLVETSSGFNLPLKQVFKEARGRHFLNREMRLMETYGISRKVRDRLAEWKDRVPVKYLDPKIIIENVRSTTMIKLFVDSPYREYTKAYAYALTKEFLILKKNVRANSSESALLSLTNETEKVSKKLIMAQSDLQEFRRKNPDIAIEQYETYESNYIILVSYEIAELKTEKTMIEKQIYALENSDNPSLWVSMINDMQSGRGTSTVQKDGQEKSTNNRPTFQQKTAGPNSVKHSTNVAGSLPFVFVLEKGKSRNWETLEKRYALLMSEQSRIKDVYKPKHPDRIKIEHELDVVVTDMKAEIGSLLETFRAKLKGIDLELEVLEKNVVEGKKVSIEALIKRDQLKALEEREDRLEKLYDVLLKRVNEIQVSAESGLESFYIVEAPRILDEPIGPKRLRNIFLSFLFGFGVGCVVVFFLDYIDDSIKSADDLKKFTGLPAIGVIHSVDWNQEDLGSHNVNLPVDTNMTEAYRTIRTNLLLSSPEKALKCLLITSAVPSEGKTTVSVNTAVVLAQGGLKTLIIDGDLRRPTIHKMFRTKNDKGVSTILLGQDTFENCVKKTDSAGVDFLSAGPIVPDPPKLFHHGNMRNLLDEALRKYDKVIIDSAPVLTVTDSLILSEYADGILFVVHGLRTSKMAILKAKEMLSGNASKMLGAIINNLPIKTGVGYYQYKYYGYKYGYAHSDAEKKASSKKRWWRGNESRKKDTAKHTEENEQVIV